MLELRCGITENGSDLFEMEARGSNTCTSTYLTYFRSIVFETCSTAFPSHPLRSLRLRPNIRELQQFTEKHPGAGIGFHRHRARPSRPPLCSEKKTQTRLSVSCRSDWSVLGGDVIMIPTCNITLAFVRQSGPSIDLPIISALMHPRYSPFHNVRLERAFNGRSETRSESRRMSGCSPEENLHISHIIMLNESLIDIKMFMCTRTRKSFKWLR